MIQDSDQANKLAKDEKESSPETKTNENDGDRVDSDDRHPVRERGVSENRGNPSSDSASRDGSQVKRPESRPEQGFSSSITNSDDPELVESRLFIGNLPTDQVGKREVEEKFCKYGKILGCSVHKGFGFIQYERVEEARLAIKEEGGTLYHGLKIDVKLAKEGRGGNPPLKRPYHQTNQYDKHKPAREEYRSRGREPPPPSDRYYPERSRSPHGYDRREDSYRREAYPPSRERDYARRDEHYEYKRPSGYDEYHRRDDPYRRAEEDHAKREARERPAPPPPASDPVKDRPIDAYFIVIHKLQRSYSESIENRLKEYGVLTDMVFLTDEKNLQPAIEDIGRRGALYAITVSQQHEMHRSLTLNILQGTPQEHRNMPLEDAISFISKSFDDYISILKEKAERQRKEEAMKVPLTHLLSYLADGRYLTVEELDRIQYHIRDRKNRLLASKGLPAEPSPGY